MSARRCVGGDSAQDSHSGRSLFLGNRISLCDSYEKAKCVAILVYMGQDMEKSESSSGIEGM